MTVDEYRAQHVGKQIDLDNFPKAQPFQCVDLVSDYAIDVCGAKSRIVGNAKDFFGQRPDLFTWVKNTPSGVPPKGAIFVYGNTWGGGYGHVGIVLSANTNTVTLLEQNIGFPRVTIGTHYYGGSIGWGVPKKDVNGTVTVTGGRYQAIRFSNVRIAPRLNAALGGSRQLHPNEWFDAAGVVVGDTYQGNNKWVKSLAGNYIWSGNLKKIG